jgi:hypothetical protein
VNRSFQALRQLTGREFRPELLPIEIHLAPDSVCSFGGPGGYSSRITDRRTGRTRGQLCAYGGPSTPAEQQAAAWLERAASVNSLIVHEATHLFLDTTVDLPYVLSEAFAQTLGAVAVQRAVGQGDASFCSPTLDYRSTSSDGRAHGAAELGMNLLFDLCSEQGLDWDDTSALVTAWRRKYGDKLRRLPTENPVLSFYEVTAEVARLLRVTQEGLTGILGAAELLPFWHASAPIGAPNLVPVRIRPGGNSEVYITVEVCNFGDRRSPDRVRAELLIDDVVRSPEFLPPIDSGRCGLVFWDVLRLGLAAGSVHRFAVEIDPVGASNALAAVDIAVPGALPDFEITALYSRVGQGRITAMVCNNGHQRGGGYTVEFSDENSGQVLARSARIGVQAVGQCSYANITYEQAGLRAGQEVALRARLILDPGTQDWDESNRERVERYILP